MRALRQQRSIQLIEPRSDQPASLPEKLHFQHCLEKVHQRFCRLVPFRLRQALWQVNRQLLGQHGLEQQGAAGELHLARDRNQDDIQDEGKRLGTDAQGMVQAAALIGREVVLDLPCQQGRVGTCQFAGHRGLRQRKRCSEAYATRSALIVCLAGINAGTVSPVGGYRVVVPVRQWLRHSPADCLACRGREQRP